MIEALDRTRFGNIIRALLAVFALAAILTTAAPQGAMALEDDSTDVAGALTSGVIRGQEALEASLADDAQIMTGTYILPRELKTPDSLLHPAGIAVDKSGMAYVVAAGNDRIDVYANDGSFIESWGDTGSGPGEFIFHDTEGDWNFGDIAIDDNGNFYVADPGNNRVQVFDADRDFVRAIGDPGYPLPGGVTNMLGYQDLKMTPAGVAVDNFNDKLYIADAASDTVKSYSLDGIALNEWGMNGPSTQAFGDLFDIAVASDGSLWVADFGTSAIFHLDHEGDQMAIIGSHGLGAGQFMGAAGIAIDQAGMVYVTDYLEGDVQVIKDGKFVNVLNEDFGTPTYMTVDNDGTLWVSYEDNNTVVSWVTWEPPVARTMIQ